MTTIKRKKFICTFCKGDVHQIDYKDAQLLSQFVTYYRSIQNRFHTGVCLKHQKSLAVAIKRARTMGLLPFVRHEK
jgi:small subunit ribosomal protein S18